ncbi:hypothetical protein RFI_32445 [Reticulomyxa filosa]|uniref:EF-hand domain-containing protein n=1 Tax=Reticulomyxa filosa TaxID=46433 RepID=X6LUZ4_RETFI|nr:hypothetical protein RFI_32445 [Reticulomyxa filosa]|eukprot:ETO04952.1 hypothetical protein RFI_32445 [Reticulomyxa filosa]
MTLSFKVTQDGTTPGGETPLSDHAKAAVQDDHVNDNRNAIATDHPPTQTTTVHNNTECSREMDEEKKDKEDHTSSITLVEPQKSAEAENILEMTTVAVENDVQVQNDELLLMEKLKTIDIVALDENKDNLIGKNEFIHHFISKGISDEAAQRVFAELDTNNDENISPQEYTLWLDHVDHTKLQALQGKPL